MSDGTPIPVTVGATVTGIDFALATGGWISGVVRDAVTKATMQGLLVDIVNSAGATASFAATEVNGSYTSIGLPPGPTSQRCEPMRIVQRRRMDTSARSTMTHCSGCNPLSGTLMNVQLNVITSNVDFLLNKGERVAGQVEDSRELAADGRRVGGRFNAAGLQAKMPSPTRQVSI